jgi:protein tyrosine phosphatase (PTP) superfamily phosphohydrolase (DUF442 family)
MGRPAHLLILFMFIGAQRPPTSSRPDPARIEAAGLHNVFRITEKLISGCSPDGDAAFQSLKSLGVKTIISVDGANPDLERAHKYGFRYVHVPFGYDGIPREQMLRLAKAVRDLPGPIYIHCHHGIHRGPAAAAAIHHCLDESCTVEQAIAEMHRAGTDPRYQGLYRDVRGAARPSAKELDAISANFPETAKVPDLAQLMAQIDQRSDNLKEFKKSNWKTPPQHPDIDPPHEALQLVELFREASRLPSPRSGEEFRHWLGQAEAKAGELERNLRRGKTKAKTDLQVVDKVFSTLAASCTQCHAKYRDVK